jgi:hypothetical protein
MALTGYDVISSQFTFTYAVAFYYTCCIYKNPGVDGRIILKWIFKTWDGGAWTGLIWLRIGTGGGLL